MTIDIVYLADQIHHVVELAGLHHGEWGHLSPQLDVDKRVSLLKGASRKCGIPTIFIAVDGPDLVGSAALVKNDMKNRRDLSPWLAAVYVKLKQRQNGIASALVARVESEAIALRVERLYLFTEHQEHFYKRRGWKLLEHTNYYGTHVAVMSKQLINDSGNG